MKFGPFRYQLVRYFFSGGTAAVVDLGLLYILTEHLQLWYLWSAMIAFSAAVVVSFTLQKFWTFEEQTLARSHRQFMVYLMVALSNLALNTLMMFVLVNELEINYLFAQILVAGSIAVGTFFVYRKLFSQMS